MWRVKDEFAQRLLLHRPPDIFARRVGESSEGIAVFHRKVWVGQGIDYSDGDGHPCAFLATFHHTKRFNALGKLHSQACGCDCEPPEAMRYDA